MNVQSKPSRKVRERFKMSGRGLMEDDPENFDPLPVVMLPASFAIPSLQRMEAFVAAINSPLDATEVASGLPE
ncbi:hypothetical protein [uncultured Bradyrhizobium sp.]|jgi:hypothetical protein|uniref:hypothetical protein n=1 Tax=uncultured Bradyrhizobium sp. TaxID=199684 RepID=UPI002628F81A|nr:hypothetical protein [uncultured Bradyrhizobium sp.]